MSPIPVPYNTRRRAPPQRARHDPNVAHFKDINIGALMAATKAIGIQPSMSRAMKMASAIRLELRQWVMSYKERNGEYAEGMFERDWTMFRVWVPLQMRLCVEQILWTEGFCRHLVTGFDPVGKARGTQTVATKSGTKTLLLGGPSGESRSSTEVASDQELLRQYAIARRNQP